MGEKIARGYGSIPHLSTSKMSQQADKKIHPGQERILTKQARDWRDLVIVTEKIDGGNVAIVKTENGLRGISRAGYGVETSPYRHHHVFGEYVAKYRDVFDWLPIGWRLVGEWCEMVCGTFYDLTDEQPFVVFDLIDPGNNRVIYLDLLKLSVKYGFSLAPLLHIGQPISIKNAQKLLGDGHYGKPENPEGFVYRCERGGVVEFLAKWVRHDKEDGKYMDECITQKGFSL